MKKFIVIAAILVFVIPLISMGCGVNAGPDITQSYDNTNFTNVQVGSAFEVELTPSATYSIGVTAPKNFMKHVKVEQSGSTLRINADWNFWNWGFNRPQVKIAMPQLETLDLSGAVKATATGFSSNQDFKMILSGASTAEINVEANDASFDISGASKVTGDLKVHDVRVDLSGASTARLDGSGNNLNIQASGASNADLAALTANDARVDLSGASRAHMLPNGKLDVFLTGASRLEYGGNAKLGTVEVSGGSTLSPS